MLLGVLWRSPRRSEGTSGRLRRLGGVTDEIRPGKRTLIEHNGREFDLPSRHTATLYRGRNGPETYVALNTLQMGSIFLLRNLEERDDAVVVHLGDEMGRHGPGAFGDAVREPLGYPFPSDPDDPAHS